jgi:hypothetical protein
MRAILVVAIATTVLGGCWYSTNLTPGTRRPDFGNQRDPDPMADPNRNLTENMWAKPENGEAPRRGRRGKVSNARRFGSMVGAALAYAVAGWTPLVQVQGEFEEDPDQAKKYRAEDAALDAEEAKRKETRVEQAPGVEPAAEPEQPKKPTEPIRLWP